MNLEELQKDLESLKRQRDEAIAAVNACAGAIQYIESKIRQAELAEREAQAVGAEA